jgi:hypothetical protein
MVKEGLGWELEKGDELIIFNRKTKRKIAEGTFHSIGCGIVSSIKKGKYYNGSFISHFNVIYPENYKGGGIHGFNLKDYKFKLKHQLENNKVNS